MSERMLRFEAQRRPYAGLGFLKAPQAVEHPSEFAVCVGEVRLQAQCLAQACLGLVQTVEVSQRSAAIGPYLRNVAPDRQRMIIAFQRLLVTLARGQATATFVPKPRASRVDRIFKVFREQSGQGSWRPRVPQGTLKKRADTTPA